MPFAAPVTTATLPENLTLILVSIFFVNVDI
jgi:hypothetical protein